MAVLLRVKSIDEVEGGGVGQGDRADRRSGGHDIREQSSRLSERWSHGHEQPSMPGFAVQLELLDTAGRILGRCSQRIVVPREWTLVRWARQAVMLFPVMMGMAQDEGRLVIADCMQGVSLSPPRTAGFARVSVSTPDVAIMGASVEARARLSGLQWLMHHWFVASFLFGVLQLGACFCCFGSLGCGYAHAVLLPMTG